MLLTTGERISMSLLSMALADLGVEAASFTGSQAGIITDTDHTRPRSWKCARTAPRGARRRPSAGGRRLQGVSTERDITTSDEGART